MNAQLADGRIGQNISVRIGNEKNIEKVLKITAEANPDQIDLFYLESVLVSTGWNKNDDVCFVEGGINEFKS